VLNIDVAEADDDECVKYGDDIAGVSLVCVTDRMCWRKCSSWLENRRGQYDLARMMPERFVVHTSWSFIGLFIRA